MEKKKEWWHDFFEKDFRPFFGVLPARKTIHEVRYIIKKLGLKAGDSVLDCPCGFGRVSVPLAKMGMKVTGVDITGSYLEELKESASKKGLKIATRPEDMRKIQFRNQFDAAVNLATSLGYFEDDRDNLLVVRKLFQAIKPGGHLMMHIINRDWIIANFSPNGWMQFGNAISFETRRFDYTRSINQVEWSFMKDGETHTHHVTLRVYAYHELIDMFRKAGFVDITGFGSIKDEPVDRSRRWIWIFGTKPKR